MAPSIEPTEIEVETFLARQPDLDSIARRSDQLLAAHTAMECYRRAMLGEQRFEGRRENLSQANKLSRSYAVLGLSVQFGVFKPGNAARPLEVSAASAIAPDTTSNSVRRSACIPRGKRS
jgi:hypothetical protein